MTLAQTLLTALHSRFPGSDVAFWRRHCLAPEIGYYIDGIHDTSVATLNAVYLAAAQEITALFTAAHIPHCFVKGIVYDHIMHQSKSVRSFDDLDILVDRKSLKEAKTLLLSLGFIRGHWFSDYQTLRLHTRAEEMKLELFTHETASFTKQLSAHPPAYVNVDIIFQLFWAVNDMPTSIATITASSLSRVSLTDINGVRLPTLDPLYTTLFALWHAYERSVFFLFEDVNWMPTIQKTRMMTLKYVYELCYFLRSSTRADIEMLIEHGLPTSIYDYTCAVVNSALGVDAVDASQQEFYYLPNRLKQVWTTPVLARMLPAFDQHCEALKFSSR